MRHHDAVLGCLREGGFTFRAAVHAYSLMDAYIYGFALQERGLPFDAPEETGAVMARQRQAAPEMGDYPYLVEAASELGEAGYDFDAEFAFGLDVILDRIQRLRGGVTVVPRAAKVFR